MKEKLTIALLKEAEDGSMASNETHEMKRSEAIKRIAKAICKISCACKYYSCGNCTEFLEHYTPDLAEAALNSLLEDEIK